MYTFEKCTKTVELHTYSGYIDSAFIRTLGYPFPHGTESISPRVASV